MKIHDNMVNDDDNMVYNDYNMDDNDDYMSADDDYISANDSHSSSESTSTHGEYAFLFKRTDFDNADPKKILWHYAIKSLHELRHENRLDLQKRDYSLEIERLLNLEPHNAAKEKYAYTDEFQVIFPDGLCMKASAARDMARIKYTKKDTQKNSFCTYPNCHCPAVKESKDSSTMPGHALTKMGVVHYCVPCGTGFKTRQVLRGHAINCDYQSRVIAVCPQSEKPAPPHKKNISHVVVDFEMINDTTDTLGPKCWQWVKKLLETIQGEGYMKEKTIDAHLEELKQNYDEDFTELFRFINKFASDKYKVKLHDDPFYTIHYYSNQQPEHDLSKSAKFKLIERSSKTSIPYKRLIQIREETLSLNDGKCHYVNCPCDGNFQHEDPEILAGHGLIANVLVVCVGCKTGFVHFDYFKAHLKSECFLERRKPKKYTT